MAEEKRIDIKPFVDTGENEQSAEPENWTREQREPASSYRDLGTAGGGPVPGASGTNRSPGGILSSDSTVEGSGPSEGYTGRGKPRERGTVENTDLNRTDPAENARNTIDRQAQSNIGGRNPGQPQTSMGDRDAHAERGSS